MARAQAGYSKVVLRRFIVVFCSCEINSDTFQNKDLESKFNHMTLKR